MGTIITRFVYNTIEKALEYSSFYSDVLVGHNNTFIHTIYYDGEFWTLEFKIDDRSGEDNSRDSKGTRYLNEPGSEDS